MPLTFLTAEWRKLAMANYLIDPKFLKPYLPDQTELDDWQDQYYLSLVGFLFKDTRILGLKIPFHSTFEEVNLRFYVRYKDSGIWKRGVVFIKEFVPKLALSLVANRLYNEHYETLPMRHSWNTIGDELQVEYQWKKNKTWNRLSVTADNQEIPITADSEAEFITEHYWGYTRITDQKTSEYGVQHPRWKVYPTKSYSIDVDFLESYGPDFAFLNRQKPASVFLAEGSEIKVQSARRL